jgi:hypothetical protein
MPAMYHLTSGSTSTRGGVLRGPTNTWTGPISASRTIQLWLSLHLNRCLTGLGLANVSRSAVTPATVAPVQRLPVSLSSAAKRQAKRSAGSAPDTASVQSKQMSRKPSPATSPANPDPVAARASGHFGRRHRSHITPGGGRTKQTTGQTILGPEVPNSTHGRGLRQGRSPQRSSRSP